MNNLATVIVYLWFAPVLGFIVLPLLWSVLSSIYRLMERTRLSDIRGFLALNNRDQLRTGIAENRGCLRIGLKNGTACIARKDKCWKTPVSNISKQGICLHDVPQKVYQSSSPLRVLFRTRKKNYLVTAMPVWKKVTDRGYDIGVRIDQIPNGWKGLVGGLKESLMVKPA